MSYTAATVQLLSPDGDLVTSDATAEYLPYLEKLTDDQLREFHRQMVVIRRFDHEAANLQRQGQMALWIPSHGQEAAQVGSAFAAKPQDHLFPAYREHVVGRIRGLDVMKIIELVRGLSHGGWVPAENGNFHLYTLVIGSQALHATGYAMGVAFDGATATGNPETDVAVMVYFGDGATSQGDVSEAFVFAASYQTPQVFFMQNNHWAISVPVTTQSRTPLYLRPAGFGIPSVQIDGNDVLASYAVTAKNLDDARAGHGPRFIEALTYRIGAHTTSDDPTKYRDRRRDAAVGGPRPDQPFRGIPAIDAAKATRSSTTSPPRPRTSPPTFGVAPSHSEHRRPRRCSSTCTASRMPRSTRNASGSKTTNSSSPGEQAHEPAATVTVQGDQPRAAQSTRR